MRYSDDTKLRVKEMYLNGMNSTEISKIMNIKIATIT